MPEVAPDALRGVVKQADDIETLLKQVAVLEFKILPPQVSQRARVDKKYANDPNGAYKDGGPVVYSGAELKSAHGTRC